MAKSMTEKVLDIFVGTVARDMSKTALKKVKEMLKDKTTARKKLRRTEDPQLPEHPELEP